MKRIETLKDNQIFVFGSNANGNHAGGAARQAVESFGAVMGQAKGLQGQSYAIVTLDGNMQKVSLDYIREQLEELNEFAKENDGKVFLLTLIGCGIAGFSIEEIKAEVTKIEWTNNVDIPEEFRKIQAFKGFNEDMSCRGYQFEVGKEYEEDAAIACQSGFHACRNPFDVLTHYPLVNDNGTMSRFAEVEQSGLVDDSESDKTCSSRIKIKAEIGFPGFIKACVEWIKEITNPIRVNADKDLSDNGGHYAKIGSSGDSAQIGSSGDYAKIGSSGDSAQIGSSGHSAQIGSSGHSAQIGSSGDSAQIGSSGDYAQIGSSGHSAQIGSSGDSAQIGSSGDSAQIGSSGDYAKIGSSGDSAQIGSSGDYAKIGSSGDSAQIGSSGHSAQIGSSGDSAQIGSSGDSAQIGSSGDYAQIGSSGHYAKIGSSGHYAKIGSSGDSAKINSEGADSVICCAGHNSSVKAKKGSWITLSEWKHDEMKGRSVPVCVKTEYVDGERIKADTWYKLANGEFVEVK